MEVSDLGHFSGEQQVWGLSFGQSTQEMSWAFVFFWWTGRRDMVFKFAFGGVKELPGVL